MASGNRNWLEDRTGAVSALREFLYDRIPASIGWRNTLGSLAGALLLVQIVTGFLIALYYVPHPEAAYASLQWFADNITLGWFVRALHYWGASFIVVGLFLHACRVFFSGAYKKPREVNWLVGLALLGVVVLLAFTGQLLPYNQMGYWAATVGIQIASSAPIIGDKVGELLRGGDTVGALTLTRFYALHVVLLPIVLGLLVGLHLYLLRRHGPKAATGDTSGKTDTFFPAQFFRDMVVISVALVGLGLVAAIVRGPHSGPLDLSATDYTPRPEWYFLAHYELLRLTQGQAGKVFVAFVLPNVFLLLLVLLPWLDRGRTAAFKDRPITVGAGIFVIAGIVGLTLFGLATAPEQGEAAQVAEVEAPQEAESPEDRLIALGRRVYRQERCTECHMVRGRGREIGPNLTYVGARLQEDYLREWLKDPERFKPDTVMPAVQVRGDEFDALVFYLMSLKDKPEG